MASIGTHCTAKKTIRLHCKHSFQSGTKDRPVGRKIFPSGTKEVPPWSKDFPVGYKRGTAWSKDFPVGYKRGTAWSKDFPVRYKRGTAWSKDFPVGYRSRNRQTTMRHKLERLAEGTRFFLLMRRHQADDFSAFCRRTRRCLRSITTVNSAIPMDSSDSVSLPRTTPALPGSRV